MLTAALAFALSAGGLAVAGLRAHRRRWRSATRWLAVSLLPAGLYLSGLSALVTAVGRALGDWATGLVLDPAVWIGLVLLAASGGLLGAVRWSDRRRERPAVESAPAGAAAAGAAQPRPEVTTGPPKPKRRKQDAEAGEFADIEEILRRRGI